MDDALNGFDLLGVDTGETAPIVGASTAAKAGGVLIGVTALALGLVVPVGVIVLLLRKR